MDENKGLLSSVTDWFTHPFNPAGTALDWLLFLGLLIIAAWFWHSVIFLVAER